MNLNQFLGIIIVIVAPTTWFLVWNYKEKKKSEKHMREHRETTDKQIERVKDLNFDTYAWGRKRELIDKEVHGNLLPSSYRCFREFTYCGTRVFGVWCDYFYMFKEDSLCAMGYKFRVSSFVKVNQQQGQPSTFVPFTTEEIKKVEHDILEHFNARCRFDSEGIFIDGENKILFHRNETNWVIICCPKGTDVLQRVIEDCYA